MNLQGSLQILDCTVTNQFGESVNLIMLSPMIEIYESIYDKCLTGQVTVADSLELLQKYRMTSQESLTLRFRQGDEESGSKTITKVFKIYSTTDIRTEQGDAQKTYKLQFVDPYFFKFQRTVIDRTFRGSQASMLARVLTEDSKVENNSLFIEETTPANRQLVCPKWNVLKFIDYVCKDASPLGEAKQPTYDNSLFFYQSLALSSIREEDKTHGRFYFKSFNTMISDITDVILDYYPLVVDSKYQDQDHDEANSPGGKNSQIMNYKFIERNNCVKGEKSGLFSSRLFNFDLLRGIFETYDYDLESLFNRDGHLSDHVPYYLKNDKTFLADESDEIGKEIGHTELEHLEMDSPTKYPESNLSYAVNSTNMFSNRDTILDYTKTTTDDSPVGPEYRSSAILERNALISLLHNHALMIQIPFRDDIKVGEVIRIQIPPTQFMEGEEQNKLDNGLYVVLSIKYQMTPAFDNGVLTLEVMKEGLDRELEKAKVTRNVRGAMR